MFITNRMDNRRIYSNDYKKQKRSMGIIILIVVMVVTFFLGRYALQEGLRIEENNKILSNLREMELRDIMDKRKEIIMDDGVCEGEYVHPEEDNPWVNDPDVQDFLEHADKQGPWSEEDDQTYLVAGMTNDREREFIKFQKKQLEKLSKDHFVTSIEKLKQ